MPRRACMTVGASNYGIAENGEYVGDDPSTLHFEPMCEFGTGNDADEEDLALALGNTDFTTHADADARGNAINTDRDRDRSGYIDRQTTNKKMNWLPILFLGYFLL